MQDELRQAIDAIPGLVWSALPDGTVDFLNQRWCDYTGMDRQDACGWGWQSAVHHEDRSRLDAYWRSLLHSRQPGELEARLRRFDGACRWFLIRAVPLCDQGGDVVKWYGQNTDIDDRKRAEALLSGEKRLLEMMAAGESLPAVLEALCRLVEETTSGCLCAVLLVDSGAARVRHGAAPGLPDSYNQAIDGRPVNDEEGPCGMAAHLKAQVIAEDIVSDPRWATSEWCALALAHGLRACWSTPILSSGGTVLGTFAIYWPHAAGPTREHQTVIEQMTHLAAVAIERGRTASALREAADELRRSEAFLTEAQRLSSTGSFLWRVAEDEIVWSEQVYRIYELDPSVPLTFERVGTRIHPDEALWFQELLGRARRDGMDLEFEHRLRMDDRSIKHLHVVATATRDTSGRLEYIGAVQDVTERRRSEEALDKVRSELAHIGRVTTLGALTASIAHEVSQPLSGIVTNASTSLRMLADDPPNVEGARETARRTIRDANRASEVIARLRALFKSRSTPAEPVDLNQATQEVLAILASELQRFGTIVRTELAADLPLVTGDRVQLQQVVLNLVLNAAEAMSCVKDRPRQLAIRTEHGTDDHVHVTIVDTGPGIDPEHAHRLFETFYTTKRDGMGMGLYVSRSIVESHQGRLRASANDGPGATFAFSIPRVPPRNPARRDDPPRNAAVSGAEAAGGKKS